MGERVDLDWAENCLSGRASNGLGRPLGIDVTLALVAELRVAREVVEAVAQHRDDYGPASGSAHTCRMCRALARYERDCPLNQHTQPSTREPGP
jgi:hypothetical protein